MSQHVVKVARDALALGELGELLDLFMRELEFGFRADLLRGKEICAADHDTEKCRKSPCQGTDVQQIPLKSDSAANRSNGADYDSKGIADEWDECGNIDQHAAGRVVAGQIPQP